MNLKQTFNSLLFATIKDEILDKQSMLFFVCEIEFEIIVIIVLTN